jgi:hypothetical protein
MKIFRLLFFSALFLFLLVTGISLFIPSEVRISRATNVLATPQQVWNEVDDMRTWSEWNPFFSDVAKDSILYTDSANGKATAMVVSGTSVKWKEVKADERIAIMQNGKQKSLINGWRIITHSGSDSTTMQWYMDFHLRWYPWEKFASLMFERSYGTRIEEGLNNLKKSVQAHRTSSN